MNFPNTNTPSITLPEFTVDYEPKPWKRGFEQCKRLDRIWILSNVRRKRTHSSSPNPATDNRMLPEKPISKYANSILPVFSIWRGYNCILPAEDIDSGNLLTVNSGELPMHTETVNHSLLKWQRDDWIRARGRVFWATAFLQVKVLEKWRNFLTGDGISWKNFIESSLTLSRV